jgi:hypothetical protein
LFVKSFWQGCHKGAGNPRALFLIGFRAGAKSVLIRSPYMPYVQSTALEQVSYDEAAHTLRARFRNSGRTYIYHDVPQELYDGLIFSDSLGAYFNAHIRDRFDFEELKTGRP